MARSRTSSKPQLQTQFHLWLASAWRKDIGASQEYICLLFCHKLGWCRTDLTWGKLPWWTLFEAWCQGCLAAAHLLKATGQTASWRKTLVLGIALWVHEGCQSRSRTYQQHAGGCHLLCRIHSLVCLTKLWRHLRMSWRYTSFLLIRWSEVEPLAPAGLRRWASCYHINLWLVETDFASQVQTSESQMNKASGWIRSQILQFFLRWKNRTKIGRRGVQMATGRIMTPDECSPS